MKSLFKKVLDLSFFIVGMILGAAIECIPFMLILVVTGVLGTAISSADENLWMGKSVLILGDSLVGEGSGLEMGLRGSLKAVGATVTTEAKIGGRAGSWAKDDELEAFLGENRVDAAIVVLGMNSCRTPPKTYGKHVRALAQKLKDKECYWVGPPLLVEGTAGFILKMKDTVEANSHCRYFSTIDEVEFQPGSVSGFHVRRWKGKRWAKSVWAWMHEGK
jgi:hypothetical protein